MSADSIPVSLVLGSGGARGLAHIGVIKALTEDGRYKIGSVSGSSIGALVGGLYAAGKLDIYEEWVLGLSASDVWALLDFSYTRNGLFKGERLIRTLRELVGDINIEDLAIEFTAVASDIERRREVWLEQGPLFEAIRASIAIPGFFTPVDVNGCTLVDGGLLSPLPIPPVQRSGTEQMVVVSLNGQDTADINRGPSISERLPVEGRREASIARRTYQNLKALLGQHPPNASTDSAIDIMAKSLEAMQDLIARYQMAAYRPDTLIEISVDACGLLDFHRARDMIDLGYRQARRAIESHRIKTAGFEHRSSARQKVRAEHEETS
ncbi:serine protease [Proteobacteria bacterium 005FR1]|nr:serine protease [Proteobacteria bacterium 005FR1]